MNCQLCHYEKLSDKAYYIPDVCGCTKHTHHPYCSYGTRRIMNVCNLCGKSIVDVYNGYVMHNYCICGGISTNYDPDYLNECIKIDSVLLEKLPNMEEITKKIIKKHMQYQQEKKELKYLYLGRHAFYDLDDFMKYNVYNSKNINLLFAIFAGLFYLTQFDNAFTYDYYREHYFPDYVLSERMSDVRYKKLKSLRYIAIKNYQKLLNERARTHKGIIDKYNQMHKLHDIFIKFTS